MQRPLLEAGEKLHIMARRAFKEDLRRHFAGTVVALNGLLARVEGYVFVLNTQVEEYRRRPEFRTRILGLTDANLIINVLPPHVDLDRLRYELVEGRLYVTDGLKFRFDVNEFGSSW